MNMLHLFTCSHLFQSCLRVMQDNFSLATRDMHSSFQSLTVTDTLGLQAFLMDIHHNTSLRFILKDDFISLASKACICSCSNNGTRLWLVAKPFICSFRMAHSTFISMSHFHLSLIQPSASSFLTCEYGHELDAYDTHLVHCSFGGQ